MLLKPMRKLMKLQPAYRSTKVSSRTVATLAAALTLALAGCATPVLQPTVEVPGQFAAAHRVSERARGRLVGKLRRPGAVRL